MMRKRKIGIWDWESNYLEILIIMWVLKINYWKIKIKMEEEWKESKENIRWKEFN